jgi:hypothetical protein
LRSPLFVTAQKQITGVKVIIDDSQVARCDFIAAKRVLHFYA